MTEVAASVRLGPEVPLGRREVGASAVVALVVSTVLGTLT